VHAPPAFRQQLLAAMPRLRRYARALLFDPQAADDLVQTALERALVHWQQFDQGRDLGVWLLSIAHNAHLDQRRRDARMTPTEPALLHDTPDPAAADVGLRMDLVAALRRLTPEHREPLLLVGVEQLSYAEVAELLRIPVGTVMSRVSRARAALRALLDGSAPAAATAPHLRRVV
jgi:RNA polymerase sigma-70 factor (ECF subfamily)